MLGVLNLLFGVAGMNTSLIPRSPLLLVLQFVFCIIHRSVLCTVISRK